MCSLDSQYKNMVTKISDIEAKYKVADEKIESSDEEYSNKFEDMKETFDIVIEDKMCLFVSGFEWLTKKINKDHASRKKFSTWEATQ